MALWLNVVQAATALNTLLLLGLTAVWVRNYRTFGSKHALGLAVFGTVLLTQNAYGFYVYAMHPTLNWWYSTHMSALAGEATMALHGLETAAILFLVWITWD